MGPRRVGKTVMLYHTIDHLLAHGHNPLKIAFVSVETPIYNNMGLEHLFALCRKASGQQDTNGWFVFFDEIQYLKDWEVHLKSLWIVTQIPDLLCLVLQQGPQIQEQ